MSLRPYKKYEWPAMNFLFLAMLNFIDSPSGSPNLVWCLTSIEGTFDLKVKGLKSYGQMTHGSRSRITLVKVKQRFQIWPKWAHNYIKSFHYTCTKSWYCNCNNCLICPRTFCCWCDVCNTLSLLIIEKEEYQFNWKPPPTYPAF